MQTAIKDKLLEQKKAEYDQRKVADEKQELKARFRLNADDIAVYVRVNPPLQAFLTTLTSKDNSHVLRLSRTEAFVRDIRFEASKATGKKLGDLLKEFDPTLDSPGKRSDWPVLRGYLIDIKTAENEKIAAESEVDNQAKIKELETTLAKNGELIKAKQKEIETVEAEIAKTKGQIEEVGGRWKSIFTSNATLGELKARYDFQLKKQEAKLKELQKELENLSGQSTQLESNVKMKSSSTKFWADNQITAGLVQGMVDELMQAKGMRDTMRRTHELTDKKKALSFVLEKIFDNLDKKKFRDQYGLSIVQKDGKSTIEVDYTKIPGLKDWMKVLFMTK